MLINSDNLNISNLSNNKQHLITAIPPNNMEAAAISIAIVNQTRVENLDIFDKLYISCVESKLI